MAEVAAEAVPDGRAEAASAGGDGAAAAAAASGGTSIEPTVTELWWGTSNEAAAVGAPLPLAVVVASDVVYDEEQVVPLARSLYVHKQPSSSNERWLEARGAGGAIVVGHEACILTAR